MNGKFLLFGRDKIENSLMGFSIARLANNAETSGDSPNSAPQSTDSRQESRALPMRAVIALLDNCRC